MDEGSKYFLAMLINKLQVSCKVRKVKDRVLNIFFLFQTWRRIIILAAVL